MEIKKYEKRISAFKTVAIASSFFDKVTVFRTEDFDSEFANKFYEILASKENGDFIWKPYIIKKVLKEMNNGDVLIYCDAGCHIN